MEYLLKYLPNMYAKIYKTSFFDNFELWKQQSIKHNSIQRYT